MNSHLPRTTLYELAKAFKDQLQSYTSKLPEDVMLIVSLFSQKNKFWDEVDSDEHNKIMAKFVELVVKYKIEKKLRFFFEFDFLVKK